MKPLIAIVGRPNVGKSTFFNRLTRSRDALVDDRPGVTRDRHYGTAVWNDAEFALVDTGGFSDDDADGFSGAIRLQVSRAVSDADMIIVLFDGKGGISPFDREILNIARKSGKTVFYAVNKIDGPEQENSLYEFYGLGIDKLYPVSAEHRYGVNDFMDEVARHFPGASGISEPDRIAVAVVGRPNVGKSSLINRILGQQRVLVSDTPGTTRDAVDTLCDINGKPYRIIDTAGIRRKGKVSERLEKFSVIKALKSLDRCDVALIVLDAAEGITEQDISIAGYAVERGCGCILLMNKWDAVEKDAATARRYAAELRRTAKFLHFAPSLTISALTGLRVKKIFGLVEQVYDQYERRLGTGEVNRILSRALEQNEPPLHRGKRLKFFYMTQTSTKPPTFVCFVNHPDAVHFSYRRYLVNQIRLGAGFDRTPIRMIFRERSGRMQFEGKPARKPVDRKKKRTGGGRRR